MIIHGRKQISELVYARKASEGGGAVRLTNMIRGGAVVFGGLEPKVSTPYSKAATAALKTAFPTQWETIWHYGWQHPEIVPYVNQYPIGWGDFIIGYQMVEYIETNGTQFLKTGTYDKDVKVTSIIKFNRLDKRQFNGAESNGYFFWGITSSTQWQVGIGTQYVNINGCNTDKNTWENSSIDGTIKLNGENIFTRGTRISTALEVYLGRTNNNTNVWDYANYYSFMSENEDGSLGGWLIPCYDKVNEEIGMFDVIQRAFRTNAGTGTFLKGSDIYYPGQSANPD